MLEGAHLRAPNDMYVDSRMQSYMYFGSFDKAALSMFEVTLGNWVPITRNLQANVSAWFGPIMMAYKCIVGFAVVKVITGVFLHETFKCASSDDELMILSREREIRKHVQKMEMLFAEADHTG